MSPRQFFIAVRYKIVKISSLVAIQSEAVLVAASTSLPVRISISIQMISRLMAQSEQAQKVQLPIFCAAQYLAKMPGAMPYRPALP
jgi:hypothetical protein